MPPKARFTREEIVCEALKIVSRLGTDGLTAKTLKTALNSSASPIFTVFDSMEEIRMEVYLSAMRRFEEYVSEKSLAPDMPIFKQVGMKMILFGMREPKLYQLLFMRENQNATSFSDLFGGLGSIAEICIEAIKNDYGLTEEQARELFENVWIYTFGIGALSATGVCRFSEERLGEMLTTEFKAMMLLIKSSVEE